MKENILKLRAEGKSYRDIMNILGCSSGTISYHCGEGQKEKSLNRQRKLKNNQRAIIVKKLNAFTSRGLKMKTRDFQRKRTKNGKWYKEGKNENNFKFETILKIIIDNPICYLTGDKIDLTKPSSFSFDHILPVSKGGSSIMSNLGLCTKEANMSKTDMTLEEYLKHCEKVLVHNGYNVEKI